METTLPETSKCIDNSISKHTAVLTKHNGSSATIDAHTIGEEAVADMDTSRRARAERARAFSSHQPDDNAPTKASCAYEEHDNLWATSCRKTTVSFTRAGKCITASVEYPQTPPTQETDRRLAYTEGLYRELLCPGCSDQEVALRRCHGVALADHILSQHPSQPRLRPRGLQNVFPAQAVVPLIDRRQNVFIGRRPPRGMPTKRLGAKRTLRRSKYANPFVVQKKNGFALGESLELYRLWIKGGYADLASDVVQSAIDTAPNLSGSVEEMLRDCPELFE